MIEVHCGPQSGNGKSQRLVVVNRGQDEYRDTIDANSGFQREQLLQRAAL
jgi:hypothetical protein